MEKPGETVETSIVFLRKKRKQAVKIQAVIRGFIARCYYQRKVARHQKRLAKQHKKYKRNAAATSIQSYARRFLVQYCRKLSLPHLRQRTHSAVIIQAQIRGYLKRHYHTSDVGKLELRLLQIQRQEQKDLRLIEQTKLQSRKELDRTRKDLRHEQAERAVQQRALEEQYNRQQELIEQLKDENKHLRTKIDRFTTHKSQLKTQSRSLHYLEERTDHFQSTLQTKIMELKESLQQTRKVEMKWQKAYKQGQSKLDRVTDKLGSEKRQQYVYIKCMESLLNKLEQKQLQHSWDEGDSRSSSRRTNYERLFEDCLAIAAEG